MSEKKSKPIPVRMDEKLAAKVAEASERSGLAQADIMRLALSIGIKDLEKFDYDIAQLVSDSAHPERAKVSYAHLQALPSARVAEEPKTAT